MKLKSITRNTSQVKFTAEYNSENDDAQQEERTVKCKEPPLKVFDTSLQKLGPVACVFLELPAHYKEGLTVEGITLSHTKAGTRSATIRFTKKLETSLTAKKMDTPAVRIDPPADGDNEAPRAAPKERKAIANFIKAASDYVTGKRAQGTLPLEDQPQKGDDDGGSLLGDLDGEEGGEEVQVNS